MDAVLIPDEKLSMMFQVGTLSPPKVETVMLRHVICAKVKAMLCTLIY